jgi:hypothetical protein
MPASRHTVQLFDDLESLADGLRTFIHQGLVRGERVLVVTAAARWQLTAAKLTRRGVDVDESIASKRLAVHDSVDMLKQISKRGRPDRDLFDETIGTLVRKLRSRGAPLRVYGDIVDLLAADDDFAGALQLENLWNELMGREPVNLLCGYFAVNFGDTRTAKELRLICCSHTHVRSHPRDVLGSYLAKINGGQAPALSHVAD